MPRDSGLDLYNFSEIWLASLQKGCRDGCQISGRCSYFNIQFVRLRNFLRFGGKKSYRWVTLQWRHIGRDSISSHQPHDCLLYRLFSRRSKKTPKLRVTGLCAGNSLGTNEFRPLSQLRGKCFYLMTSSWIDALIRRSVFHRVLPVHTLPRNELKRTAKVQTETRTFM